MGIKKNKIQTMKNINYFISSLKISIVLSFLTISSQAADILVNSSGLSGSYTTISDAVQAANAGDRILISPQSFPYQDSIVIDKDLTLMPYADNSDIYFDGHIRLVLDNINNFTIIGFREVDRTNNNSFRPDEFLFKSIISDINDTSTNSLSTINIIDCVINVIRFDQPKTSLYLSYSTVGTVAFSHGNIVGNRIHDLYFGIFDYSQISSAGQPCTYYGDDAWMCDAKEMQLYWNTQSIYSTNTFNSSDRMTECELFAGAVPFGNTTVSDTCLIVANVFYFTYSNDSRFSNFFSLDFAFNMRNNIWYNQPIISLACPTANGTNQIINNTNWYHIDGSIIFHLAYCPSQAVFNFSDVNFEILNNKNQKLLIRAPNTSPNSPNYSLLPVLNKCIYSYNEKPIINTGEIIDTVLFKIGPQWYNDKPNPDLKYLNLDLTENYCGHDGGSYSPVNYFGSSVFTTFAGSFPPGGKARITYLNLPTQIFNPSNIRIKSKAVHGN